MKPGRDQEFLDAHTSVRAAWAGLRHVNMIKTGERTNCIIAERGSMDVLAAARPAMIKSSIHSATTLDDLGSGLGLTDPVSGPVVLALEQGP